MKYLVLSYLSTQLGQCVSNTWMQVIPGRMEASKSWIVKKCKNIFYHLFNSVKYLYLPSDTFRKHVERHVTRRKLSLKLTGYCRQTSYTDSAVVFTLLPAVAWVLKSQFAPGYMHYNICFEEVSGKIWIFHNEKLLIEVFWLFCLSRSWRSAGTNAQCTAHAALPESL